jgi:cytochrome c peroxidase
MAAYPPLFESAFPGQEPSLTYDNVGKAIGAFERNLTTPGRWDEYLGGDADALSAEEVRGLQVFMETGCTTCHNGTLLGGTLYQKVGLVEPWPNQEDQGRFALTGNEADRMVFKVPSLRNIEETGPYFHDSSALTLDEAVSKMARHQLGKPLDEKQRSAIVAFLSALTGDIPAAYIDPNRSDAGGSLHTQH